MVVIRKNHHSSHNFNGIIPCILCTILIILQNSMNLSSTSLTQLPNLVIQNRSLHILFAYPFIFFLNRLNIRINRYLEVLLRRNILLKSNWLIIEIQQTIPTQQLFLQPILISYLFLTLFVTVCRSSFFYPQPFQQSKDILWSYLVDSILLCHRLVILLLCDSRHSFPLWWNYWILFTEFFCLLWKTKRRKCLWRLTLNSWVGSHVFFVVMGLGHPNCLLKGRMMLKFTVRVGIDGVEEEDLMLMKIGAAWMESY